MNNLNPEKYLLEKVEFLEKAASDFGFRWENGGQIMAQIRSELLEISEHIDNKSSSSTPLLQEEIGDLIHAAFSLCVFFELSPQETLEKALSKFERRFMEVKKLAHNQGLADLVGRPFDELMNFWNQAKKTVG